MKVAIVTAIFGDYDDLYSINNLIGKELFDFYCVTNTPISEDLGWYIRRVKVNKYNGDKRDLGKNVSYYKLNAHKIFKDYDIIVWVDGNKRIINGNILYEYCESLFNDKECDILFRAHWDTKRSLKGEGIEVIRTHRDSESNIKTQINGYLKEGFPDNLQMIDGAKVIRKTTSTSLNNFLDIWWNEIKNNSHRRQISYGYSIWKSGFTKYRLIENKEFLTWCINTPHKKQLIIKDGKFIV